MRNRNSKLNKQKYDKYKFDKKVNAFQFFKYISFIIIPMLYSSNSININIIKIFLKLQAKRGLLQQKEMDYVVKKLLILLFPKQIMKILEYFVTPLL